MQHDGRGSILIHCNFTYHHAKYSQFAAEVADFWTQLFHLQRLRRKCTQRSSQSTLGWAEPHEELHFRKHKDSSSTDRDEEERSLSHKHLSFWLLVLVWQIRADTNEAAPVGGGQPQRGLRVGLLLQQRSTNLRNWGTRSRVWQHAMTPSCQRMTYGDMKAFWGNACKCTRTLHRDELLAT